MRGRADPGVVAEAVETAEQLAALTAIGCGFVQGFYFSQPLRSIDAATLGVPKLAA